MLGTRTKQVFSYGRRGNRIVNVSERLNTFNNENLSLKVPETQEPSTEPESSDREETPTPRTPPLRPIRRYRKRKVASPTSILSPSPGAVRAQKSSHPSQTPPSKPTSRTGRRPPLSTHSPNIPRSPFPAALKGKKKSRAAALKGTPLKQSAPPVVEFDVIVLDDKGRRVSQERRVSRTNVQVNTVRNASSKEMAAPDDLANNVISDSEDEYVPPKRMKRRGTRAVPVIVSSKGEDEELLPPPKPSQTLNSTRPGAFASKTAPSAGARLSQHIPVLANTSLSATSDHRPARPIGPSHSHVEGLVPARPLWRPQIDIPAHPVHLHSQAKIFVPASPALKRFQHILGRQPPVFSPPPPTRSKPHHLTPIRHDRSNFMRPPSPPSPTTPTEFDLSVDFAGLDVASSIGTKEHADLQPAHLLPLLTECGQDAPHDFSSFIKTFPYDPIVRSSEDIFDEPPRAEIAFQKIGEASYSEVFGIGDVVLKVIPIRDEGPKPKSNGFVDAETPAPSDAKDVLKEMIVTEAVGAVCGGFVKLLRTYVVRGKYPSLLLSLWDEYAERKGSESIRPDSFGVAQVYAIIVLPNGGPDLEAYTFASAAKNGWRQACSLFWQVARSLSQAEDLVSFEHRDLHWGQILVKNIPPSSARRMKSRLTMDHPSAGVKATIIDLGLSRMDDGEHDSDTHWTPFDEENFEGEGDYQFDVYRLMRQHNGNNWEAFRPLTNVLWLHYLTLKLLNSKRLRPPSASRKSTAHGYSERDCYECLLEMESLLATSVDALKKSAAPRKGRRRTHAPGHAAAGPQRAGDVLEYGVEKGWINAS